MGEGMIQNLDPEWILPPILVALFQAGISASVIDPAQIVSWFDPMSVDEADRIVVIVPDGQSEDYAVGNAQMTVEVGVKTQWAQSTLTSADVARHRARVVAVRSLLWVDTLVADLTALAAGAMGFNFIQPQRQFKTEVNAQSLWSQVTIKAEIFSTIT